MNKEQLIQGYFANRLSEKERATVEHMIETDIDFKSEFESHRDITIAFKLSEAQNLKTHFQQFEEGSIKKKSVFNRFKYVYLAIASIVILGLFYNIYNTQSSEELFNSNFEIYPNTYQPVTRSTETNKNNKAFVSYENGDFITSEKEFELLLKTANNPNIRFYYASSLLNQSKFNKALNEFTILNDLTHDYVAESLWYSALLYIKNENVTKAKKSLEQLNSLNSTFKSKERKQLLKELEDI